MKALLTRHRSDAKQTLGELKLFDAKDKLVFTCKTLELAWRNNQRNVSCIPVGTYNVIPRTTEKRGKHYLVQGTEPRQLILFHTGNYYTDIQGCVLVGSGFSDINKDGYLDVINSKITLNKLVQLAPRGFNLKIV